MSGVRVEARVEAPAGWDEAVLADGGTVFHTAAWVAHAAKGRGGEPLFLTWTAAGGDVAARAAAVRRPPSGSRAAWIAGRVSVDAPPVGPVGATDFVTALRAWGRRQRALLEIELGSFDARGDWAPGGPPAPRPRVELVMALEPGEELRARLDGQQRRNVARAAREGVETRRAASPDDARRFADLVRATDLDLERRKGVPAGPFDAERTAEAIHDLCSAGRGGVWLAEHDGVPAAGVLFGVARDACFYVSGGASAAARDLRALPAAMHAALADLQAAGVRRFNLGGVEPDAERPDSRDHGLLRFKQGFGGTVVPRTSGALVLRPRRAAVLAAVRRRIGR